jgi:hypothetical protein
MSLRRIALVSTLALNASFAIACGPKPGPKDSSISELPLYDAASNPLPGGRVVAVTLDPLDPNVALAATQSGGIFRTRSGGAMWEHLDGLDPNRLWDVQIHPNGSRTVIASVGIDTRIPNGAGIWRSTDGGTTWQRPPTAVFARCGNPSREAYGRWISLGPGSHAFVATDCGLAVSHDYGRTWTLNTMGLQNARVSGVFSRPGPFFTSNANDVIVDACIAASGPRRSVDAGGTFGPPTAQASYPNASVGECFVAGSPDESNVIFAAQQVYGEGILWESDDGGVTWTLLERKGGRNRYPWVRVTRRPPTQSPIFELFFHNGADVFVYQCSTKTTGLRCAPAAETAGQCSNAVDDDGDGLVNEGCDAVGAAESQCANAVDDDMDGVVNDGCPRERGAGPPHDYGGMAFLPNGCPRYMGNDHGMVASTDCGQTWQWRNDGLRALQIYDLAGTMLPNHTDLYFTTQDNYTWASFDGGVTWPFNSGSESLFGQAPYRASAHGLALFTFRSCLPCSRQVANDHLTSVRGWPPAGDMGAPPDDHQPLVIPGDAPATFVQLGSANRLWVRDSNGQWSARVPSLPPVATDKLLVAGPATDPTIYAITTRAGGQSRTLQRVTGLTQPTLTITDVGTGFGDIFYWSPDDNPFQFPYVAGVAPTDGRFVMVAEKNAIMWMTADGGGSWYRNASLEQLITDGGSLAWQSDFHGLQAHIIKYNPVNVSHVLVGTEAAGVIESCDAGLTWRRVTASKATRAVSDFFFDANARQVFVATYGRGMWRIKYPAPSAGQPDPCWQSSAPALLSFRAVSLKGVSSVSVQVGAARWRSIALGQSTEWRVVAPGNRKATVIGNYQVTFGAPCSSIGLITLAPGQRAMCPVTVERLAPDRDPPDRPPR